MRNATLTLPSSSTLSLMDDTTDTPRSVLRATAAAAVVPVSNSFSLILVTLLVARLVSASHVGVSASHIHICG